MKLERLLKNLKFKELVNVNLNTNISSLELNSKNCKKNSLFFCINGFVVNGEDYVVDAIKNGAVVVVSEKKLKIDVQQIVVKDVRKFMAECAKAYYCNACDKLKIIGITGTNGKTTTTYVIKSVLGKANIKCGVIGTNGTMVGDVKLNSNLTTPDPIELHKLFYKMLKMKVKVVVMEISAHAIYLNKIDGIKFNTIVLTNITEEHLDFFGDMNNYINTKFKVIDRSYCDYAVINADCENCLSKINKINVKYSLFGIYNPSDTFAINIYSNSNGLKFVVNSFDDIFEINSNLFGKYNVYNILSAIAVLKHLKISNNYIIDGLKNINVLGRQEVINFKNNKIIIDYAHTPDGIKQIVSAINKNQTSKVITLFGCVGYSNAKKRKDMLEIACASSDYVVFTCDNPNFVKFSEFLTDLKDVLKKYNNVTTVENRSDAVKFAINLLKENDVLLLLGKGNETTQLINGVYEPYNEKQVVVDFLKTKEE